MTEQGKLPLLSTQYALCVRTKDGVLGVMVGPDPLDSTTVQELEFVVPDEKEPSKMIIVTEAHEAIREFITVRSDEYIVIHNPTKAHTEDLPNGGFSKGFKEALELDWGKKRTVIKGNFPLWPGQWVERRSIPFLNALQYLTCVVESVPVDKSAPYYDLTVRCAEITTAIVDHTVDSKDEGKEDVATIEDVVPGETSVSESEGTGPSIDDERESSSIEQITSDLDTEPEILSEPEMFKVGQLINILGSLDNSYIPPSGIEIVSVEEESDEEESVATMSEREDPSNRIYGFIQKGSLKIENLKGLMDKSEISPDSFSDVREYYLRSRDDSDGKDALFRGIQSELDSSDIYSLADAIVRETALLKKSGGNVIRDALLLGSTEFCVIIDEKGNQKTKEGPGRVFPGPYDHIRTEESRGGIYDSYHIRPDRGILIRTVAKEISKEELRKHLPSGTDDKMLDRDKYGKGDEIFLGGFDAYVVPQDSFGVIDPQTRQPHIGNDHSNVYVSAIGVDQKSGVYVADVETGDVKLVCGEKKLLLDPRKEKHQKRYVPSYLWDLMIGESEPHKKSHEPAMQRFIENGRMITPWALSIPIPNNEAVLVISKDGRRPVVGPCTELLKYEETLEIMNLSQGRPKSDGSQLETCFLRVNGNRVTDRVTLETADKIQVAVDVEYGVTFVGETDEEREKWFNFKDYVMLLATNTRSRLRGAAQSVPLIEIDKSVSNFVRDVILGIKGEEDEHRHGLKFAENNMHVTEVEVIDYSILDESVSEALAQTNKTTVKCLVEDNEMKAVLESNRLRKKIYDEEDSIAIENAKRNTETAKKKAGFAHEQALNQGKLSHVENMTQEALLAEKMVATEEREDEGALRGRKRKQKDHLLNMLHTKQHKSVTLKFRSALVEIQKRIIETEGKWDVDKLNAIQPQLVKAIEGLGDKQALAELAHHLPEAGGSLGFLTEAGGIAALKFLTQGTKFEKAIDALNDTEEEDVLESPQGVDSEKETE